MSKRYKKTIPLFGTYEVIQKAVISIVTDSSGERPENVYSIHRLFKTETELASLYEKNKGKYKKLKDALVGDLELFIAPFRNYRDSITADEVRQILNEGKDQARERAHKKIEKVRLLVCIS